MTHKVTWDEGAPFDSVVEAVRRVYVRDGIPRHVYEDGLIMKYDWVYSGEHDLVGETLEEHIAKLIEEQDGKQG